MKNWFWKLWSKCQDRELLEGKLIYPNLFGVLNTIGSSNLTNSSHQERKIPELAGISPDVRPSQSRKPAGIITGDLTAAGETPNWMVTFSGHHFSCVNSSKNGFLVRNKWARRNTQTSLMILAKFSNLPRRNIAQKVCHYNCADVDFFSFSNVARGLPHLPKFFWAVKYKFTGFSGCSFSTSKKSLFLLSQCKTRTRTP